MHNFSKNLLTEWRKLDLPFSDKTFVVAVSGGADSISLALALHELRKREKLNLRFVLAHFNHDLRGEESREDEQFVKDFAGKFEFELACKVQDSKIKIQEQKGNLEQNARSARYEFLYKTAGNLHAYGILTAHTLNDQAETFLANLIRGSGLEGLGGMKPVRTQDSEFKIQDSNEESAIRNPQSAIRLIRPLLNWAKREDTEDFCRLNEIEFRYDSMNENLAFNRVRIRKILLPLLEDFNPKIVESLANTASLLREDFEFLVSAANLLAENEQESNETDSTKENAENSVEKQNVLQLKELKNLFPSMRRQILRDWLKKNRGDLRALDAKHFEAIENLIFSRKSGREIELPNGETILKEQGKIAFVKNKG